MSIVVFIVVFSIGDCLVVGQANSGMLPRKYHRLRMLSLGSVQSKLLITYRNIVSTFHPFSPSASHITLTKLTLLSYEKAY